MESIKQAILKHLPLDGSQVGNQSLMKQLREAGLELSDAQYEAAKESLVAEGLIAKGRGRGGAVYRTDATDFDLSTQQAPAEAPAPKRQAVKKNASGRKKPGDTAEVLSYRYDDKRTNNPHVGMVDTYSDGV
ncbi:MAG: hypothetical protein WD005_01600, partial [Haliea sp.]